MGKEINSLFGENKAFKESFGYVISKQRRRNKLTQGELAELINLSENSISDTECGKRNCVVYNFYLLIHLLSIPQEDIIKFLYNPSYLPEDIKEYTLKKDK